MCAGLCRAVRMLCGCLFFAESEYSFAVSFVGYKIFGFVACLLDGFFSLFAVYEVFGFVYGVLDVLIVHQFICFVFEVFEHGVCFFSVDESIYL